ncbi:MAG: glycosyltransferase [Bacteroidales bacterium]|nr:glycosyltransferase [Bacteroidales bacterium]
MNKKIIIVGPAYPYRGGQPLVEAYLHKTITSLGYDTNTISYKLLYPKVFFPGKTQYDNSKFIPFEHNNNIQRLLNSINPFSWWKTYKQIKKEKPDVVIIVWWMFFFGPCLGSLSFLIKHFMKQTKICFLIENYISHENHFFEKIIVKQTLKYAHCFIAESHYIYNEISKDFPKAKIYETTLSVFDIYNMNRYDKQSAREFLGIKNKNVLLFFGLIRKYKGLDALLYAMPKVLEQKPDTKLMIVGECYEDFTKYQNIIDSLHLNDSIMIEQKFIANEDVEPYFKACDYVVMPYHSATQSGILMMAYGFRRPVIATNVGGMGELVNEKTGLIIENNSQQILSSSIVEMLEKKEEVDYGANIEEFIQNIGYNNINKILSDLTTKNIGTNE